VAYRSLISTVLPALPEGPGHLGGLAAFVALLSNLVSNVPAVMLLAPLIPRLPDPQETWLLLAMASTFAGNLTLLGSVANLIVAGGARQAGINLGFWSYLRVGLPVTVVTICLGTAWLALT
jgi:Na+/H+ antiporter NhaD/arsenite permease-like protein